MIKGGGIAITGQEQRQLGGGFLEGDGAPPGKKKKKKETLMSFLNCEFSHGKFFNYLKN